jgi:hypothetical protein
MLCNNRVDEEDYGGHSELIQEGLPGWMGSFLVRCQLPLSASANSWMDVHLEHITIRLPLHNAMYIGCQSMRNGHARIACWSVERSNCMPLNTTAESAALRAATAVPAAHLDALIHCLPLVRTHGNLRGWQLQAGAYATTAGCSQSGGRYMTCA